MGPSAGPPAWKSLLRPEEGDALAELVAAGEGEDVVVVVGAGEAVVVVVGAGEGEEGVVMGMVVVVCCASTARGASDAARSANPAARTARVTIVNLSTARVRSVISPPALAGSMNRL
jgi:hypothetical protein